MTPIYLDYNATTPVDPAVASAMRPFLDEFFGNPSSSHIFGVTTRQAVIKARDQVASMLNARPDEIIFTSGGSESNNFALKGAAYALKHKGNHLITSYIEHPSVLEVFRFLEQHGFEVTYLEVDGCGLIDPQSLASAIRKGTILISVMHANNEVGTIQPVAEIGEIARAQGILFHSDAAQTVGKIPVDVESMHVDLLSIAGHKFYAPKGIGALYIRRGVKLEKLIHGADHESNQRAGTENVIHIAGLGAAAGLVNRSFTESSPGNNPAAMMLTLKNRLLNGILNQVPEARVNGHPDLCLPNTLSLGFPSAEASLMLASMKDLAASAGAACHSDHQEISGVLSAMKVPLNYAVGTIRFSLGKTTTEEEIDRAIGVITETYRRIR
jgi:cysteine desulfurase NifS